MTKFGVATPGFSQRRSACRYPRVDDGDTPRHRSRWYYKAAHVAARAHRRGQVRIIVPHRRLSYCHRRFGEADFLTHSFSLPPAFPSIAVPFRLLTAKGFIGGGSPMHKTRMMCVCHSLAISCAGDTHCPHGDLLSYIVSVRSTMPLRTSEAARWIHPSARVTPICSAGLRMRPSCFTHRWLCA